MSTNVAPRLASILLLAALAFLALGCGKRGSDPKDAQTFTVKRTDLRDTVSGDGSVEPYAQVDIKSKAAGEIVAVYVEPGDFVHKGDKLMEIDPKTAQDEVRTARATLQAAKAQLALVKRNQTPQDVIARESTVRTDKITLDNAAKQLGRIKDLFKKGYASQSELDAAQQAYDTANQNYKLALSQMKVGNAGGTKEDIQVAQASVTKAQAALDTALETLSYTTVRAPMDGVVLTRPVDLGNTVASGINANTGGTVVATIGDLNVLYCKAFVDESDIGRVKVGQEADVSVDAYPDSTFVAKVVKIYPKSTVTSNVTTFEVDVQLSKKGWIPAGPESGGKWAPGGIMKTAQVPKPAPKVEPKGETARPSKQAEESNPSKNGGGKARHGNKHPGAGGGVPILRVGMSATAEILIADHPNVLAVPVQYVKTEKGKSYVMVKPKSGKPEKKIVTLGFSDGAMVEIGSGLSEGDIVVLDTSSTSTGQGGAASSSTPGPPGGGALGGLGGGGGPRGR
jgi:HlyD family secretion protein